MISTLQPQLYAGHSSTLVWAATPVGLMVLSVPRFLPGTEIEIVCPVTSRIQIETRVRVMLNVHQGSALWDFTGDLLESYISPEQTIAPGETVDFAFRHVAMPYGGRIDRDLHVYVEYWDGDKWQGGGMGRFPSIYEVGEPGIAETLTGMIPMMMMLMMVGMVMPMAAEGA